MLTIIASLSLIWSLGDTDLMLSILSLKIIYL